MPRNILHEKRWKRRKEKYDYNEKKTVVMDYHGRRRRMKEEKGKMVRGSKG